MAWKCKECGAEDCIVPVYADFKYDKDGNLINVTPEWLECSQCHETGDSLEEIAEWVEE